MCVSTAFTQKHRNPNDVATLILRVIQEHPSLVQAASYIAAAIAKEGGEGTSGRRNISRIVGDDYESDEELRGMEPGVGDLRMQ